jgi:hypothetical protein
MDDNALVTLTIRYGTYGHESKSIAVPIDATISRKLLGTVELSDAPFSLMLASPSMYGGKENAVTVRRKTFEMRRDVAEQIARAMVPAMLEAFGVNDELDGHRVSDMSESERDFRSKRGQLPPKTPR